MRPLLRTATLTVAALTALTTALLSQSPPHMGSPMASPVTQQPASSDDTPGPEESLTVAYGLTSNSHGAPPTSSGPPLASAPALRSELHSAYWLAIQSAPPSCHPTFSLLAAIGQVESGSLVGRRIDSGNDVVPALIGPALDGKGHPSVRDTDAGQLDDDPVWDRAVGPMQLVPVVWRAAAVDMDGDGTRDPQNVFDAAGAAMVYLCAEDRDLSTARGVRQAVLSYNNSPGYLRLVLAWKAAYDRQQDQTLNLQAVLGTVAPFSQGQFSQGLSSRVPGAPSGPFGSPVLAGAQPSSVTLQPGLDTGHLTSTPSAPAPASAPSPSPSSPSTPRPSGPDPTPGPNTEPPVVATPGPTPGPTAEPPVVATPGPAAEPPAAATPDPTTPAPAPLPEPAPTCVIPPVVAAGVDPSAAPTDGTVLCPSEVVPVDPVPAP